MKIAYSRPDGGTSVITPAYQADVAFSVPSVGSMTAQQFLDWVIAKDVPADATNVQIVEDSYVPDSLPSIPQVLSRRQAFRVLYETGMTDAIAAIVDGLPGADGDRARIDWREFTEIQRSHPLIPLVVGMLGVPEDQIDAQVDAMFVMGASL